MAGQLEIVAGPAGSGKSDRLRKVYLELLAGRRSFTSERFDLLWLSPNRRSAMAVRRELTLASGGGLFRPGVMTFDQFAGHVVESSETPAEPINAFQRRRLLAGLLARMASEGRLEHFGPIAERAGLVDLVADFVRELKRLEIWPDEFLAACRARGGTPMDRELHALYEQYQQQLLAANLFDPEGRFWLARTLLQENHPSPFDALRLVVVDGFTDFTRTQHEILVELARRGERMSISLLMERESGREELFDKSHRTLAELQRRRSGAALTWLDRPDRPRWPALDHVERHLFGDPRRVEQAPAARGIEILATAKQTGQIEAVARRIKQLLVEGAAEAPGKPVRPDEIAVVFRSLTDSARLVRDVFAEQGIPFSLEQSPVLRESPGLRTLLDLLRLEANDWPYRALLSAIANRRWSLRPIEADLARAAAERVVRRLAWPRGRDALLARAEMLVQRDQGPEAAPESRDETDVASARALLQGLAEALGRLPRSATLAEWRRAIDRLGATLGLVSGDEVSSADAIDRAAWQRMSQAVDALAALELRVEGAAPVYGREAWLALLEDLIEHEPLPMSADETGRVRVLSAASVRALEIPYLFIVDLAEGAFPRPDREDRLYGEAETRRLAEQGLPLATRDERASEELLLFYEVVTRATRFLCLAYPAMDDKAQPLLPSPYLTELERVFGPGRVQRTESLDLNPARLDGPCCSATDLRVTAMAAALAGEGPAIAAELAPAAENLVAGLRALDARRQDEFGAYDGLLTGAAAKARLAARFNAEFPWSASQLEAYSQCPFKFLLAQVLGLQPIDDLELAIDYGRRGHRLHELLAHVHHPDASSAFRDAWPDEASYLARIDELAEVLLGAARDGLPGALDEIDRRVLLRWARGYREQFTKYLSGWTLGDAPPTPAHFEVSFGLSPCSRDPLSTERPLKLRAGDETIRITGRIDRIDLGRAAGQAVFNVIDYKTSSRVPPAKHVVEGRALQLSLYMLAVERVLLPDHQPLVMGYWHVRAEGFKEAMAAGAAEGDCLTRTAPWEQLQALLGDRVGAIVEGVRGGEFPVFSDDADCTSHCEFHTVCRVGQTRALEKPWSRLDRREA